MRIGWVTRYAAILTLCPVSVLAVAIPMAANDFLPRAAPAVAFGERADEERYDLRENPQQHDNVAGRPRCERTPEELRSPPEAKLRASRDPRFPVSGHQARNIEGWTVFVNDRLPRDEKEATARALDLMRAQLETIVARVPAQALAHLRTVPLWLSPPYEGVRPKAEYHPAVAWLREHGRDPAMAKCIEFTNVFIFEAESKRMPLFVLHELAHAYHDQVLGFDDPAIMAAYRRAVESGGYDAVKNHAGKTMRAYALTDPKEYFAESSEAFFGRNDFYPFNRAELREHDPEMYGLLERLWNGVGQSGG